MCLLFSNKKDKEKSAREDFVQNGSFEEVKMKGSLHQDKDNFKRSHMQVNNMFFTEAVHKSKGLEGRAGELGAGHKMLERRRECL